MPYVFLRVTASSIFFSPHHSKRQGINEDRKNYTLNGEKKELIHCAVSVALIYYHPFVDRLVRIRN